jgi:hypothetical protein
MRILARIGSVCLLSLILAHPAGADAIVLSRAMTASTIAELHVEESGLRAELEIGVPDLPAFRNLLPDEIHDGLGLPPEPLEERLPRFFGEDLVVRADDGSRLPGRLVSMEGRHRVMRDEITGEPLPAAEDEGDPVIFAVVEYPFPRRPSALSLRPPRSPRGFPAATIGFVLYHRGLPVTDFRYLGAEETVDLDWQDPWYSRFRNRNLRRQYDAPINAFLYVEPYEVRVEIIARPVDLQQWVDLGLEGRETIPAEIQPALRQAAAAFLAEHVELVIDGEPARPLLDRIHFLRRTLRTSMVIDPPREIDAISATLGAIFVQPTAGLPQTADLTWDLFSEKIPRVPGAATDEAGPLPWFLTPQDNVLAWKNFLKNPTLPTLVEVAAPPHRILRLATLLGWGCALVLSVVLVRALLAARRGEGSRRRTAVAAIALVAVAALALFGQRAARVGGDDATEIVSALLHNVYRAFDFREEEAIYDTLARSVTGDLLTETYLETRRGLELANQGGARAKVKQIEMLEVEPRRSRGGPGFLARCTWNVSGSVGHWGHVHQRVNQYRADLTVESEGGVWKIVALELLSEERL